MPQNKPIDITVMITCYNERDLIVDTIETIRAVFQGSPLAWEILVIDDCSKDDSAARIQAYIDTYPDQPVRLRRNPVNRGLANNFVDGAFLGRGKYYRFCSGDNSEPVEAMQCMLQYLGQYDMIIPYHGRMAGRSFFRHALSRTFTIIVNTLGGHKMHYYNGSPIYHRFHILRYPPVTFGFGFQADLITRLLDGGATYIQVPRDGLIERKGGRSTAVSVRNLLSVVHSFAEIIFRRVRRALYPTTRLLDDL